MQPRIVHLKQSGELLTDKPGERWTAAALQKAAARIKEVQQQAEELHVAGLMVVSGGGNVPDGFGRGANIRQVFGGHSAVSRYADVIGRRSTVDNTIMLAAALQDAEVPYVMLAAPDSGFNDLELGPVPVYDPKLVDAAYREGRVVLMAGGIGKADRTTDAAVTEYAAWQAQRSPDMVSVALKATKFNGVFDSDPKHNHEARRYHELPATYMLADYDRFAVVDRCCLEILCDAGAQGIDVSLRIYTADYSIVEALRDDRLGTVVRSLDGPPVFDDGPGRA